MSTDELFDKLDRDQQQIAVEIAAVTAVLITRLPALGQNIFTLISKEFIAQYNLPSAIGRSVLRHLGQELFEKPWNFCVFKDDENNVRSEFAFVVDRHTSNGEIS